MSEQPPRRSSHPTEIPRPLPGDPRVTPALVKQHKLTPEEYGVVVERLGREPTYSELGVFSVMWSEHCSYKSSRVHLKRLPTKGPRVIQGPGGGTDHLLANGLLGTEVTWAEPDGIAAALRPDTGLVVVETPANPTLDLIDLDDAVRQCGGPEGVPLVVDNTFATPVLQQPARHGAALVLHSATKYLGGHGDVLAGVVATNGPWAARLRRVRAITGGILHPLGAYLLHRGLQTLPLRIRHQSEGAYKLAQWLTEHPAVERVYYPGLADCDPLQLIGRQMSGPGAILAFTMCDGYAAAARAAEACQLITHAVSLGGIDTLIQHPASLTHRPVAADAKPHASLLRLSVGLEDVEDLRADLERALVSRPSHSAC